MTAAATRSGAVPALFWPGKAAEYGIFPPSQVSKDGRQLPVPAFSFIPEAPAGGAESVFSGPFCQNSCAMRPFPWP